MPPPSSPPPPPEPDISAKIKALTDLNTEIDALKKAVAGLNEPAAAAGGGGAGGGTISLGPQTIAGITTNIKAVTALIADKDERVKGGSRPTRRRRPRSKQTRSRR